MTLQVDLPEELIEALGPSPQREVLESVLVHLVTQGKITVAKAGALLGMDRKEAIHWYASREEAYPNLSDEDLELLIEDVKERNTRYSQDEIMRAIDEALEQA